MKQPHHNRGWQWLKATLAKNVTVTPKMKNNFRIAVRLYLKTRALFPESRLSYQKHWMVSFSSTGGANS